MISIILLSIYVNFDNLLLLIFSRYGDYLPSVWSIYYLGWGLAKLQVAVMAAVYFGVCWVREAWSQPGLMGADMESPGVR